MKRHIAVDAGKYATKSAVRRCGDRPEATDVFLTRMDESDVDFGSLSSGRNFSVTFGGHKYRIGEGATHDSFVETKTEDIHKICTYTAVSQFADNGDEVTLGIGCPLSIFINPTARNEYAKFIKGDGNVTIQVNGVLHSFTITKVCVFPESSGIVYLHFDRYKDSTVGVIDMGGLDTNGSVYKNLTPQLSSLFTVRLGGKVMHKVLLDTLNSKLGLDVPLQPYQMDGIVRDGYVMNRRFPEKEALSRKLIAEYKRSYVQEVYDACVKHDWSLDTIPLVFIGGTSLALKDEIKEVFHVGNDSFFEDAEFLNVKGFLRALP